MDDDEEEYIFFGTPLPEIEDEATLKKKAAKELQVRDEKGRQRFHGAFTGGFSAGYFNTVGTKEGWAPSTFISSRDKVADRIQQNPEDFMDDEDFGEFGIATRKIHTTANFQNASQNKGQKRTFIDTDDVIPGEAPLKDIVQPVRESVGIIILKKLGWREGQGIGPRIKKNSVGPKIYGCLPFPETSIPEEEDPMAALFTFAPKDTESILYTSKDNFFGLGYTGLSKESILKASFDPTAPTTTKSWLAKDKKKLKISGQAFGVGAYEDDDDDIYGKDDMSQYDFSELELKKSQDSHKKIETSRNENSQGVLEGFHLAEQPPLTKQHYPPPTLPPNYRPVHLKTVCSAPPKVNQSRHSLSTLDRSFLLGERKFEKASLKDPTEQKKKSFDLIESVPSSSTSSPLSSSKFQPFSNDLAKQKRYNEYLKLKQSDDISKFVQPSSMTEWEKQQEVEEFAKAAVLFKPSSNVLSSHFESRSYLSVEHDVMAALEKLKREKEQKTAVKRCLVGTSNREMFEWHPVSLLCKRMNVPNPYPNSDSSGTQNLFQSKSVFDHIAFASEKLQDSGKSSYSVSTANSILPDNNEESNKNLSGKVQIQTSDDMSTKENIANAPSIGKDSLSEDKRPPIDFFKDIFENSSSDEDDVHEENNEVSDQLASEKESSELKNIEVSNKKDQDNSVDKKTTNEFSHVTDLNNTVIPNSSKENKKVGFGVFANLDLDALNQRKPPEIVSHPGVSESKIEVPKNSTSNLYGKESTEKQCKVDDTYGPELPPNYSSTPFHATSSSRSSSKKHGKLKSSHKHKHHKHKHRKKKKKKTSRRDSSSSISSEEPDDIPPALIIEKMKKLQKRKTM